MMPSYNHKSSSAENTRSTSGSPSCGGAAVYKLSSQAKMANNVGPTTPDPLTQRAVLEQLFERRLVEGEFWYVVVAEWLEQVKKYLCIPSTRKFYHQRVHPGPIITRRDYAHTVEMVHEDAWKLLLQWYGIAEGHKAMKLVVYNYSRAPEIEHNMNSCKLMMTTSPPEDFHNVKFSKMEKVGHIEWKLRQLYDIAISRKSRLWAKPDTDGDWRPLLVRDKTIGKEIDIDSDFTRPFIALEVIDNSGTWGHQPKDAMATQDCPIGILYDHDIFEDVTSTWELDIHEQIDHIGKDFMERLHLNFNSFVQRAKDYVEERDSILRERERKVGSKEAHFDSIRDDLEEKQQRLEAEIEGYSNRRKLYDAKEEDLENEYENKRAELERTMQKKREALDTEYANFTKAKENFDTELKTFLSIYGIIQEELNHNKAGADADITGFDLPPINKDHCTCIHRMSEVYKIEENKIKLDIGGQQFTTSLLTLTKDTSSMLAAMFSGRHRLKVEVDGSYFIDRDGTHFRYILNYLRDGCIKEGTMPSNPTLWRELMTEAEYYQLSGLAEYLRSLLGGSVSRSSSASGLSEETSGT